MQAALVVGLGLHDGLGVAHVDAALDLPLDHDRVDRPTAVVGDPDLLDRDHAGLEIDADLGDVRGRGVGRRGADGAAPVGAADLAGAVAAHRRERRAGRCFGDLEHRFGVELAGRVVPVEPEAQRHADAVFGDRPVRREGRAHAIPEASGRLLGRGADHVGDAAGVGAQIDRGELGVGAVHHDVVRREPGLFGDDVGEHPVAALADVARAAEHGDSTRAIREELHPALRQLVGVDRVGRAGDVHRAGDAEAAPAGQLAVALGPVAHAGDRVQALAEARARDELPVDGHIAAAERVLSADLNGIHPELRRQLVQAALKSEARLHRAVAALGAAAGLVGVEPPSPEVVMIEVDRPGQDLSGVVAGDHAEGVVATPIDANVVVDGQQPAFGARPHADVHLHGVPSAVAVEDLFARVEDLHGAPGLLGQPGGAELQIEGLGLAAEGPAEGRLDHPDLRGGHAEDLAELAVQVVGHLGAAPDRELAVRGPLGDGAVRLDRRVGVALVEVGGVHRHGGGLQRRLHLTKGEIDVLAQVVAPGPPLPVGVVNQGLGALRGVEIEHGREHLVLHLDEVHGADGRLFVFGGDRGHAVPDVAHLVDAQGGLVGRPGDHAEGLGELRPGHHRVDPWQRRGGPGVDALDAGVGVRRPEDAPVGHPRQGDVVGVDGLAGERDRRDERDRRKDAAHHLDARRTNSDDESPDDRNDTDVDEDDDSSSAASSDADDNFAVAMAPPAKRAKTIRGSAVAAKETAPARERERKATAPTVLRVPRKKQFNRRRIASSSESDDGDSDDDEAFLASCDKALGKRDPLDIK